MTGDLSMHGRVGERKVGKRTRLGKELNFSINSQREVGVPWADQELLSVWRHFGHCQGPQRPRARLPAALSGTVHHTQASQQHFSIVLQP